MIPPPVAAPLLVAEAAHDARQKGEQRHTWRPRPRARQRAQHRLMQQVGPRHTAGEGAGAQPGDPTQTQQIFLRQRGPRPAAAARHAGPLPYPAVTCLPSILPEEMRLESMDADSGQKKFRSCPRLSWPRALRDKGGHDDANPRTSRTAHGPVPRHGGRRLSGLRHAGRPAGTVPKRGGRHAPAHVRPRLRSTKAVACANFHSINGLAFADGTETHPQNHHFGYARVWLSPSNPAV
jgi:hypothetical protein